MVSGADSQRETVGPWRNVGVDRALVEVRFSRRAAARAFLFWEKGQAGRGARQMGKSGARAAVMAWSVIRPEGEAMERRSWRWMPGVDGT